MEGRAVSRLDSFIRRMQAQRDCLETAVSLIADLPGPVLEMGLGNGRTFDHLREKLPGREVHVLDRRQKAHPDSVPADEFLHLGEVEEMLSGPLGANFAGRVALIHSDLGTGDADANAALHRTLAPLYAPLLAPGGIAVINHEIEVQGWTPLPLPDGVGPGRYFMFQKG